MMNFKKKLRSLQSIFVFVGLLLASTIIGCNNSLQTPSVEQKESNQPSRATAVTPSATAIHTPLHTITDASNVTQTSSLKPSPTIESKTSEKDGMVMVLVPEGEFIMGADRSVGYQTCLELFEPMGEYNECFEEIYSREEPAHTVWLDAYWIDLTEVTNAMYVVLLNEVGNKKEGGDYWYEANNPEARIHEADGIWVVDEGYESHPVTLVTWYGAHSYCERVGRRLPTEAEWEKAARGTDERVFPWGNEFDGKRLNFCDVNCKFISNPLFSDGYITTAPAGSFPQGASPYGVLDMAGNVYEWVFDRYDSDYYDSSPYENPEGPSGSAGDNRVLRGGSWVTAGNYTRTTDRSRSGPTFEEIETGFRCVLSDNPEE